METVMRHQIADYLAPKGGEYSLMGAGFNSLDENPNAQKDSKTYIHQKAQTSQIKSYQPTFPFDTDLIKGEAAVDAIFDIGRNYKTGADAELDYVRVDLFDAVEDKENTFRARKFTVAVEVTGITGEGGNVVKMTGNLNGVGDFVDGTFDTTTKTFTATE